MESLLIVDDEVIIADGLYHMLQEVFQDRLEVRRCYSCDEACAVLNRNRVDILLTDIEMPGASGLELHRMVRERWPMTRVIYLTGYSDFDYARRALKQRAFAYVLKSEGDQVLISTVERAVENLQEESLLAAIKNSGFPFDAHRPVRMGYGMFGAAMRPELLHQSMNLIEELMRPHLPMLLTDMNARCFSIVFQPSEEDSALLEGHLENAQRMIEQQGQQLTVCLMDCETEWKALGKGAAQMLELINQVSPASGELVTLHATQAQPTSSMPLVSVSDGQASLIRMKEYLLTGQEDLFAEETPRFFQLLADTSDKRSTDELYEALAQFMRDCSGAFLTGDIASPALERLVIKPGTPLSELQRKLNHLAQEVFNARSKKQMHRQRHIVRQIDQYIAEHLSGDLSLTAIADALHFHPTYISRVYRECSSVSFSDSIAQSRLKKACSLLSETDQSIASIAEQTGFNTANYFARWFRKWMGCTAQEYRERSRDHA